MLCDKLANGTFNKPVMCIVITDGWV